MRNINLEAIYLPGILFILTDMEFWRSFHDNEDWQLNRPIPPKIWEIWHPIKNLFALPCNSQLPECVCWHHDLAAWMTTAFSLNWNYIKMRQDLNQLMLVCPYWPSQPWFKLVLKTTVDIPQIFVLQRPADRCERKDSSVTDDQRSVLSRKKIRTRFRDDRIPNQAIELLLAGNRQTLKLDKFFIDEGHFRKGKI